MTVDQLLAELRHKNIQLWLDGDRLRYRGPESAMTSDLLARIRGHRDAIVEHLRDAQSSGPLPRLRSRSQEQCVPLSYAQRPLWFLDKLETGNASYHLPSAFRLRGLLDRSALEHAFREIIRRHEILRTTFPSVNGEPVQSVAPSLPLTIPQL